MTEESRIEETTTPWTCPKDGTAMVSRGRRQGAWRCPECGGLFLDVAAWRDSRRQPPVWAPVVMSVLASLLATVIVHRLRLHSRA